MENYSFEESYDELEKILEKLNSGETPLEESLKLYEKAETLIENCNKKLTSAEQKIQTLIKNREGKIETEDNNPKMKDFI